MRKYILLAFCLAQSFPVWACGDHDTSQPEDNSVRLYRAGRIVPNQKCIDLYFEFPSKFRGMYPNVEILANDYKFRLGEGYKIEDKENRNKLYMCLSEKILKDVTISITYNPPPSNDGKVSFCKNFITVDNLSELLAQSDQEAAANK